MHKPREVFLEIEVNKVMTNMKYGANEAMTINTSMKASENEPSNIISGLGQAFIVRSIIGQSSQYSGFIMY